DESGPKAGEKLAKLKAYGVVGPVEKKEADFTAERKDAPTIFLFVAAQEGGLPVGGRPAGRFMKKLDEEIAKVDGAAVVAIWLGDSASRSRKRPSSSLRRDAEDHVELRGQFAGLRVLHLGELDRNRVALLLVLDALPDPVAFVAGMPLHVALRGEQVLAALLD